MEQYAIIECPNCHGRGKEQQKWVGQGWGNCGEVMYTDKKEDCSRCGGLGKLKVKMDDIKEAV